MKVGDYVRTECGIAKIKRFETKNEEVIELDKDIMICNMDCYRNNCTINQVIKSSPNIIDLIEVGDYVNGHKVFDDMRVDSDDYGNDFIEIGVEIDNMLNHYIREEDIKSIVTKEQFEAIKYEIK